MNEDYVNNDIIEEEEDIDTGMSGAKVGLLALGGLAVAGAIGGIIKARRHKKLSNPPTESAVNGGEEE